MTDQPRHLRTSRIWPIVFVLCAMILAGVYASHRFASTGEAAVDRLLSWPENLALAAGQLFQAKTIITGTSISLPAAEIAELALVQRRILCYTKQENSGLGSSSVRIIKGEFEMKAGYDLKDVSITFNEPDRSVRVRLPKPRILSLSTIRQDTFHLDPGVLKSPTTEENDRGNAENLRQARAEAEQLGVGFEVEQRMKERIRDALSAFADPDKIHFDEPGQKLSPVKM